MLDSQCPHRMPGGCTVRPPRLRCTPRAYKAPDNAILSGARRWTAAKTNEWDEIECVELTPDSDALAKKYVLVANAYRTTRATYTQKKEADAYLALLESGDTTRDELAARGEERLGVVSQGYQYHADAVEVLVFFLSPGQDTALLSSRLQFGLRDVVVV